MDNTVNTLEGFLYKQLRSGVSKETLEQFLLDELDEAVNIYQTEAAYAKEMTDLGASLEPFYEFIRKYFPSLKGRIKPEEFEEATMSFLLKLQKDPAYVKLFLTTFTGKDVPEVEVKTDDDKVIYNFLKNNNLN